MPSNAFSCEIRRGGADEVAGLAYIWNDSQTNTAITLDPPTVRRMAARVAEAGNFFLIAECAGVPAGIVFATARDRSDEAPSERRAHVSWLAVRPEFRRRGIAKRLMERAIAELRACAYTHVQLWVLPENDPAVSLYRAFGFREARREKHNALGQVLLLMERTL